MRTVICHYHIYKNSGTSFDTLLSENFGDKHLCFDGPFPFFTIDQEQLSKVIERRSNIVAFSSHQIQLPVPVSLDYEVLPAVFVRHPLLRVQSIYKFKRQEYDGTITSEAAQNMPFDEWINHCFNHKQEITHISNAQTRMLGSTYRQKALMRRQSYAMIYDIKQAFRNIENVRLLARTECFDEDVSRFSTLLEKYDIEFKYKNIRPQNVTSNDQHKSLDERIDKLRGLLSEETYQRLVKANEQDINLFNYAGVLIKEGK